MFLFYIDKAIDFTRNISSLGLYGQFLFLQILMSNRTIEVRRITTLSRHFVLDEEVQQGGVLSVTLMELGLNNIVTNILHPVQWFLYVDEITMYEPRAKLSYIERHL